MLRREGWIVLWDRDPLWWTAAPTRNEAIRKTVSSPLAAGRVWRQLHRNGWSVRRLMIDIPVGANR